MFARDADEKVIEALRERGSLVKAGRIVHDYPICWRSDDRLVWLARREYFYWVDRIRSEVVRAAEKVEYFFEGPKNRFLSGLAESPAWCVTRERVWGTPLPIWVCEECGEKTAVFSRKSIVNQALELPDGPNFELHRPWVDRVVLRCRKCGGRASREPFVLDTWHNSGASPYASFTDEEFKRLVPVKFLTEAIDQTRGWAYTLLLLNVIKSGKPLAPYRMFLFQGHVLDEKGMKMSKRLGNVVQGLDLLRNNSVDVARFYTLAKASPEDSVNFDMKEMAGRSYQVMNTLYHLHLYLQQNGAVDGFDPGRHTVSWALKRRLLTVVDRWMLEKLGSAERNVLGAYGSGRFNDAARALEELIITHLSQTYVRLVRNELWNDDLKGRARRLSIYAVLGRCLKGADDLLHPIAPFATEFLNQEVFARKKWKSPLLSVGMSKQSIPRSRTAGQTVDFGLKVEEGCNSARMRAKLKRRWPLASLEILVPPSSAATARSARRTVALLCNVKKVDVHTTTAKFPAEFELRPNPARIGALFKEKTRDVLAAARPLKGQEALRAFFRGKPVREETKAGMLEIPLSAFDLLTTPAGGHEVAEKGGVFVAIRKERDSGLIAEGLVRDVARRLQALRKEKGFVPTAMLDAASLAGLEKEDLDLLRPLTKQIAFLVRVKKVGLYEERPDDKGWSESDLDGKPIFLKVV